MAEWKRVDNVDLNGSEVYIKADDVREIVAINPPSIILDENGDEHPRAATISVKGPKGGQLNISLPKQYWLDIEASVAAGTLKPGMGVDCIGWKRMYDDDGKPIMDGNGRQRTTFYPDGMRPRYYSK